MRRHPLKKLLAIALGLIVLGSLWFYLAPASLGGSTSYVVTHGISMEPRFHTGDLAIVRSQPSYHVGEIVAYHNKMLHVVALHRIIGREGERYIFKGDNNNFIDPEHPRASQLIGALWIHLPGAGATLQSFSSPARAGLLIALGMLLLTGGVFARRRRRRMRDRRGGVATPRAPRTLPWTLSQSPPAPAVAIVAIGILALLPFLVLALLAFTRAPSTRRTVKIPYTQNGTMSYSAETLRSSVYPDGVATTGEPLFTHLVNDVNLRFDYTFATDAKHALSGRGSFLLLMVASDGWHRTLQLGSPTYFRGDHAIIRSTLDLGALLELTHSIEASTHVDSAYTFTLMPIVTASGTVESVPLRATFSPAIQFSFDSGEVSLEGGESLASSRNKLLTGASASAGGPLKPSASGSATGSQPEPNTLPLGPWHMSVSTARTLALSAIGVILAALLAALALIRPILALMAPQRRDEAASILARYGGLIIPVAHITPLRGVPVIDVADMDALARIAEHYDRSILHETTAAGSAFWVADESGQFRYALGALDLNAYAPARAEDTPAANEEVPTLSHDVPAWVLGEPASTASQEPACSAVPEPASNAPLEPVQSTPPEPAPSADVPAETEEEPAWTADMPAESEEAPDWGAAQEPAWTAPPEPVQNGAWTEEAPTWSAPQESAWTAPQEPIWTAPPEPVQPSAAIENGWAPPEPAWSADVPAQAEEEPAWSVPPEPAQAENGWEPPEPAWSAPPEPAWSAPPEPAQPNPAIENGWARHDEQDTLVLEAEDLREAAADTATTPATAGVAYFAGLEWT